MPHHPGEGDAERAARGVIDIPRIERGVNLRGVAQPDLGGVLYHNRGDVILDCGAQAGFRHRRSPLPVRQHPNEQDECENGDHDYNVHMSPLDPAAGW